MSRFRTLKHQDINEVKRVPRLGKIRLGVVKKSKNGKEYPAEVDYFICPPELLKKLGLPKDAQPKKLNVRLVSEDMEENFPTRLAAYRASGLFCEGNGVEAMRRNPDDPRKWDRRECPCDLYEKGECKRQGSLFVVIPEYSLGGCWQILTGSFTSIVDVQNGIRYVQKMVGRISWVPMVLERIKNIIGHVDPKTKKLHRQTHYTLQLTFPYDIDTVNQLRLENQRILDGPVAKLPHVDSAAVRAGVAGAQPPADTTSAAGAQEEIRDATATVTDSKPIPAPTEKAVSEGQAERLWKTVSAMFHLDDNPEEAKGAAAAFFTWFVQEYAGVQKSTELPISFFEAHHAPMLKISKIKDPAERRNAVEQYVEGLREDLVNAAEREALASEEATEAALAAGAADEDVPF